MEEMDALPSAVAPNGETSTSLNPDAPGLVVITGDPALVVPPSDDDAILVSTHPVESNLEAEVRLDGSEGDVDPGGSMVESGQVPSLDTKETGHLHSETVMIRGSNEQEVISMLLQSQQAHAESAPICDGTEPGLGMTVNLSEGGLIPMDASQGLMQAVTLADGSTAFIQHQKGASKFLEGQTVTLEDGSFAVVQAICPSEKSQAPAEVQGTKFVDGQAVQLEDGTTAYIHSSPKEGLQAIQLEDGTTAYIAHSVTDGLFTENITPISLEQLACQVQTPGDQSHANTHIPEEPKPGATTIIMSSSPGRISSDKTFTMTEKAFKCVYEGCGRLYTTLHHLKVHDRSHTGDRPFKCEQAGCGKAFATGYGLKSHTRVHTGEKPYKCPEKDCDKAFKTSGDLQKHVRTHTGERPFKCPFEGCERSFTTSNIRKVHIRTHTGERPYICSEESCGRSFASATNYKNHIRIHTGEKPYVCTVDGCDKRFTEYSSLYKHHVVHTHSKPYECNHCGKNYRQTSTLAMHKRTAHNEDIAADAEAQMFSQQHTDCNGDMGLSSKRPRLEFTMTTLPGLGEGDPGQHTDSQDGTLAVPSQQVTMVMADGSSVAADDQSMAAAIQASQQAAQAALIQQLQQQGLTSVTVGDSGQQIYVVTDPAHLEALQQFAVQQQQLEIHPTTTTTESVNLGQVVTTNTPHSPSDASVVMASTDNIVIPSTADGALLSFHTV